MVRLLKNNLLKFTMKKSWEVKEWTTLDPISFAYKLQQELAPENLKIQDKIYGKHDTSKDANIVMQVKAMLDFKKSEMNEVRKEVVHLRFMIENINNQLAGGS